MTMTSLSRVHAAYRSPAALCALRTDTPLLLGLSGGADSRLLLHLLAKECKESGAPLHLAHVHHGIRGAEADRDEQFCRALADEYGLPIFVLHADVPSLARERGESIETVARAVRYGFFADVMAKNHISLLVTAHHADDNLETVLLHLARGCGLAGLGGISPARAFERLEGAMIVRPLLACSKADILKACDELGLAYVTDSTNADTAYARNLVRAQVLPALSKIADHPEQQVLRTCQTMREDEAFLCELAKEFLSRELRDGAIRRSALSNTHVAVAKRALRLWVHSLCGHLPEACHIDALMALCQTDATAKQVHLPSSIIATAERDVLRLVKGEDGRSAPPCASFDFPFSLTSVDDTSHGFGVRVSFSSPDEHQIITKNDKNVYKPFIRDTLMFDTIVECSAWLEGRALHWRSRDAGDTLLLRGINRKLRKLQNELGIPAALRDRLPLLCDGDTVIWAPFCGARDGAFAPVTSSTRHALCLTIEILPQATDHTKEDFDNDQSHS
ncbi:MAG: tRNA lysidine(34) synthetase TilS [Ruminococcaceae bacterium]|nr:tRNA lysidine(34) synthetase TilS [Oscillospiraceae bacterium]